MAFFLTKMQTIWSEKERSTARNLLNKKRKRNVNEFLNSDGEKSTCELGIYTFQSQKPLLARKEYTFSGDTIKKTTRRYEHFCSCHGYRPGTHHLIVLAHTIFLCGAFGIRWMKIQIRSPIGEGVTL